MYIAAVQHALRAAGREKIFPTRLRTPDGKVSLFGIAEIQTAVEGCRVWPDICMRIFGSGTDSYYGGNIHENFYGESGYDREKMVRS